jgi:hypothetical protein
MNALIVAAALLLAGNNKVKSQPVLEAPIVVAKMVRVVVTNTHPKSEVVLEGSRDGTSWYSIGLVRADSKGRAAFTFRSKGRVELYRACQR